MAIHHHGTPSKYEQGCRCNLCILVHEDPVKRPVSPQSVPTGEVRIHILALRANGWSFRDLAETSGYHVNTLRRIENQTTLGTSTYLVEDILSIPMRSAAA